MVPIKGIKLQVSDGNGGKNNIVWVPKPWIFYGGCHFGRGRPRSVGADSDERQMDL
jgi:hypothetical protein